MRRKEIEVTDPPQIEAILQKAEVLRLGLSDGDMPYVVPLVFGYEDGVLYMHSAAAGRKLDMLRANPNVCFEVDIDHEIIPAKRGCAWSMKYRSVIGFGRGEIVDGLEEKKHALGVIMAHYSDKTYEFTDRLADSVAIIRVDVESMTARSGYEERA